MTTGHRDIRIGETLTCAETGKQFAAAKDGCSFNYAWDRHGHVLSDEGVNIRQHRELLDRSQPYGAYLSGQGKLIVGWKGNVLGYVIDSHPIATRCNYGQMQAVKVKDIHGGLWHGRAVPGCCITLRPAKGKVSA